jgi:PPOX class probable F420-dependent enzyme
MTVPLAWLADRHQAVLVTLRADGSPQTSNLSFAVLDGVAKVSVTDTRAKTRNLRRDPRAVLHVLGDTFWDYASITCTAELSPVSTVPGDDVGRELLEVYEAITGGPHPDPTEYFEAMVTDQRLVLRLRLVSAVGQGV